MTKTSIKAEPTFTKFYSRLTDLTNDANFTLGAKLRNLDVIIDVMFVDSQGEVLMEYFGTMVTTESHLRTLAKGWLMNMETYRSISMLYGFQCVTSQGTEMPDENDNAVRLRNDCMENAREYMRSIRIFLGRFCPAV